MPIRFSILQRKRSTDPYEWSRIWPVYCCRFSIFRKGKYEFPNFQYNPNKMSYWHTDNIISNNFFASRLFNSSGSFSRIVLMALIHSCVNGMMAIAPASPGAGGRTMFKFGRCLSLSLLIKTATLILKNYTINLYSPEILLEKFLWFFIYIYKNKKYVGSINLDNINKFLWSQLQWVLRFTPVHQHTPMVVFIKMFDLKMKNDR